MTRLKRAGSGEKQNYEGFVLSVPRPVALGSNSAVCIDAKFDVSERWTSLDRSEGIGLPPKRPVTTNLSAQIDKSPILLSGPFSQLWRFSETSLKRLGRNRFACKALRGKVRL